MKFTISDTDIPDLLSNVPLNLSVQPGSGDDYYVNNQRLKSLACTSISPKSRVL